jgi:autoinducer 2-binding protein LuxP
LALSTFAWAEERDYWEHYEVPGFDEAVFEAFREVVRADAVPIAVDVEEITIALIFPSLDLSDAWARGHAGLVGRLDELGIPYRLDTFGSDHDNHALQLAHLETALARGYDYVIVGPTEILVQMSMLEEIIEAPGTELIVWNYTTPLRDWGEARYPEGRQPLAYVGFSHAEGAHILGQYFVERLQREVEGTPKVAHIRGIPGVTDDQRSGIARQYFEEAGFEIVHETYANWRRDMGYSATLDIVGAYPDVNHIHIVSTAMAIGAVEALEELDRAGEILLNGWGGGSEEQLHLLEGNLHATVMRMQDDWGVALAEIIKFHLEGRVDEIPLAFTGEMQLVDDSFTREDIDVILEYAFRYSGDLEVYR